MEGVAPLPHVAEDEVAYERLKKQLLEQRATLRTPVDRPLRGTARLPAGRHTVTITGVDTLWLATRGYLEFTLQAGDQYQRFRYWFLDFDKSETNWKLVKLVCALVGRGTPLFYQWQRKIESPEEQDVLDALHTLRGLRVGVLLEQGDGWLVDVDHDTYTLVNPATREVYGTGFATVSEATARAAELELPKSRIQLKEVYGVDVQRNTAALHIAYTSLQQSSFSHNS